MKTTCDACGELFYEMKDLVRSGRTRSRQFTSYPTPEVFR